MWPTLMAEIGVGAITKLNVEVILKVVVDEEIKPLFIEL